MTMSKLVFASIAAATALALSACATDGGRMSPAGSPAGQPMDMSDPGRENSTPSTVELRTYGVHNTAFPAGSRDTASE